MASRSSSGPNYVLRIPRNTFKIAGIAFGIGLLLFVLVWLGNRKSDFYKADQPATPATAQAGDDVPPLPEPLPASNGASDMPAAKPADPDQAAQLVETPPPPPPAAPTPAPAAPPADAGQTAPPMSSLAAGAQPEPIPGQMPAPRYPPSALRRGDQGTVVVRVDVDATGVPSGVTLVERSGSRELDRAAMEVVRQWRFRPAQQNGVAVTSSIDVPFDFKPQ